jgi:hypothetical protein
LPAVYQAGVSLFLILLAVLKLRLLMRIPGALNGYAFVVSKSLPGCGDKNHIPGFI